MKIVTDKIAISELRTMVENFSAEMVKTVVDVDKGIIAVDAELHSDLEAMLLDNGSKQKDLWGINIYPGKSGDEMIEFDSMINVRPSQGNRSRGIGDEALRKKIIAVVLKKVKT